MKTNVQAMSCGNCGKGLFRMFYGSDSELIAECESCKSATHIKPEAPRLSLDWGERAEGILCRMPPRA